MLYIFDIDGVLADVTHLLPLITGENKDYEAYYSRIGEALPIANGLRLAQTFSNQEADKRYIYEVLMSRQAPDSELYNSFGGFEIPSELISSFKPNGIYFVTGRSELTREATLQWLQNHGACGESPNLYMRGSTDCRPAYQVKRGIVERIHKETGVPYAEMTVFEDDPQCAEMYESLGCYVCHVRHGKAKS